MSCQGIPSPSRAKPKSYGEGISPFFSVQSLYVGAVVIIRTRLAIESHARRMPIVVEQSIACLACSSADNILIASFYWYEESIAEQLHCLRARTDSEIPTHCCVQQTGVHRMIGSEATVSYLSHLGVTSDLSTQCLSRGSSWQKAYQTQAITHFRTSAGNCKQQ